MNVQYNPGQTAFPPGRTLHIHLQYSTWSGTVKAGGGGRTTVHRILPYGKMIEKYHGLSSKLQANENKKQEQNNQIWLWVVHFGECSLFLTGTGIQYI